MRAPRTALLLSALLAASTARSALAQPAGGPALSPPLTPSFELAAPRAHVASLAPLQALPVFPRVRSYGAGTGLRVGGVIVLSLGLATLLGAGMSAIVAGASSIDLDEECPGKVCIEGSRGADKLERTRDAARATDWLLGIGGPVVASGTVMLLYSAVLSRRDAGAVPPPVLRAGPGGASLTFHF